MNKEELVQAAAKKADTSQKQVAEVLTALLESIEEAVAGGDKVTLVGFGTFEARERQARSGRNPQNGEPLEIPAKRVPAFTAGKKFKDLVAPVAAPAGKKKAAKK
jgi:DNA-binding protein HU-beta